jgi:hypothetical protein
MNFSFIVIAICAFIFSQSVVNARTTSTLRKSFWPLAINDNYHGDSIEQRFELRRRQAGRIDDDRSLTNTCSTLSTVFSILGWGKRDASITDEDNDDILLDHAGRLWFDEK